MVTGNTNLKDDRDDDDGGVAAGEADGGANVSARGVTGGDGSWKRPPGPGCGCGSGGGGGGGGKSPDELEVSGGDGRADNASDVRRLPRLDASEHVDLGVGGTSQG